MLGARGIGAHFVAENLEQIGRAAGPLVSDPERPVLEALLRAGVAACASVPRTEVDGSGPLVLARSLFVQALLGSQRMAALTVIQEALREGTSLIDVYVEVVQMALYEIGRLWAANRITVAQEHMATAIAQYVVAQIYGQLPASSVQRGRAIVTGVEGELHQIGANMVADVLESLGWEVRFLGTQMPHQGILDAIEEHRAGLLGISATMLFNVPQVTRLLAAVRQRFGDRSPKILLGGAAFRDAPALWEDMGADGYGRDLRDVIRLAESVALDATVGPVAG